MIQIMVLICMLLFFDIIYRNYYHNYSDTIMYYCLFFRVDVVYGSRPIPVLVGFWNQSYFVSNCACMVRPNGIANKMILKYRYIITLDNFEIAQISLIIKSSFTKNFIGNMYRCYIIVC